MKIKRKKNIKKLFTCKTLLEKEKGVTLIALVVTVVVLLILAGISINLVVGENGIVNKGKEASDKTKEATANEKVQMLLGDYGLKKYIDDGSESLYSYLHNKIGENGIEDVTDNGDDTITVKVDGYSIIVTTDGTLVVRPGIEVGDYINYTPDTASAYSKDNLALAKSGSSVNTGDITQDTLKWQILRKYDDGSMDLIGTPTTQNITFAGDTGYNNGVYLMHDICKSLYSKSSEGIFARSVNLDDFDYWLKKSTNGVETRNLYDNGNGAKYGDTTQYTGDKSYKPDIFGKTGDESDSYYPSPTTNPYSGGGSSDTLDVTQTYYNIPINQVNYGEGNKVLANSIPSWVASRFLDCYGGNYACFGLRYSISYIRGYYMFYSKNQTLNNSYKLRPVVKLPADTEITVSSTASTETGTPHTITKY